MKAFRVRQRSGGQLVTFPPFLLFSGAFLLFCEGKQYLVSMLQTYHPQLDNDRYPGLTWASPQQVLGAIK